MQDKLFYIACYKTFLVMAYSKKTIIKKLKELETNWPKGFWLFSGSGIVYLMKGEPNEKSMNENGGYDPKCIIETFRKLTSDGGDW